MPEIRLTGQLICADEKQAVLVAQHLPAHIALTRAEPGCLSFTVEPTTDRLTWQVDERFANETHFRRHQRRVTASDWGKATAEIARRYTIDGLSR